MTKVKGEGISQAPQHTEMRMVDGELRQFVVRELPPDPKAQRTTIANIGTPPPIDRSRYAK